ncbi:HEAT repeat domain-containing protein [bacterium]|jgi:HEAT repeat protein|nr:HEAT repeat domain-containing protein [bacterium]
MDPDPTPFDVEAELDQVVGLEDLQEAEPDEEVPWERRYTLLKRLNTSDTADEDKLQIARLYVNDAHPSVRLVAVLTLRELAFREVVDLLIYSLADSYEWVRIRAIEGLGIRMDPEAIEPMIRYLDEEDSPKVRATLVKHLGRFQEDRLVPIIANFLNDEDSRVRANAVEGLGFYPSEKVQHILRPLLDDPNARIRANVAVVLSKVRDTQVMGAIDDLLSSKNIYERMGAVYSIGENKDEAYISVLLNFLNDASYLVQRNVRDALVKFGISIQGILLKEIRSSKNDHFILGAIQVLARIGDKKAVKTLFRLMEEGEGDIRSSSEAAIDSICTRVDSRKVETSPEVIRAQTN